MERGYVWDIPKPISAKLREAIMETVCAEFECTWVELKGPSRKQRLSDARAVYAYFCRRLMHDTFERIAAAVDKQHSSVVHGIKRIEGFISVGDNVAAIIARIEKKLLTTQI